MSNRITDRNFVRSGSDEPRTVAGEPARSGSSDRDTWEMVEAPNKHLQPLQDRLAGLGFWDKISGKKSELEKQILNTEKAIRHASEQIDYAQHWTQSAISPEEQDSLFQIARDHPEASEHISNFLRGTYAKSFEKFQQELTEKIPEAKRSFLIPSCQRLLADIADIIDMRVRGVIDGIQKSGVHLSSEDRELLREVAKKKPQYFSAVEEFVSNFVSDNERFGDLIVDAVQLFDLDPQNINNPYPSNMQRLLQEIQSTRTLGNTQAITDFLDFGTGPNTRQSIERKNWEQLLKNPQSSKKLAHDAGFVDDLQVLKQQSRAIAAASQWASSNGFENTQWFPGGRQGKGVLFHVAWDPQQSSLEMGVMLGNRVRLTRLPAIADAQEFKVACDQKIQDLHRSLVSGERPDKLIVI